MGTALPLVVGCLPITGSGYTGSAVCSGHHVWALALPVMFSLSLLGSGCCPVISIIITVSSAVIIPLSPWKYTASHQTCPSSVDN